jgi:hypothetical protein
MGAAASWVYKRAILVRLFRSVDIGPNGLVSPGTTSGRRRRGIGLSVRFVRDRRR